MRSSGTPAARAASYEHSSTAAPWSTSMLAHMRFGYGKHTMRLSGETVRISSGEYAVRDHAFGLLGRDRGEARPQLAHVRVGARRRVRPAARAQRGLEQRVHHRRRDRESAPSRSRSRRAVSSPITHSHGASSPESHVELDAAARGAPASACASLSAPPMSTTSSSLRWMRVGELVDQQLRAVAADRRDARWRAA